MQNKEAVEGFGALPPTLRLHLHFVAPRLSLKLSWPVHATAHPGPLSNHDTKPAANPAFFSPWGERVAGFPRCIHDTETPCPSM